MDASERDEANLSESISRPEQPTTSIDGGCDDSYIPPPPKRQALETTDHCDDVSKYISSQTQSQCAASRYNLLTSHFKPSHDYCFPKGVNGRSFQFRWLQMFPWLVYSKHENGGFCLPCVLFASTGYHGSNPGVLVSRPLTAFVKALELLRRHGDQEHHKVAVVRADEFMKTMTSQQPGIQSRINGALADRISVNRQKLASIMKTIVFCGRQNIALRGHRDNVVDIERDIAGSDNHGNFLALLKFRVEAGDTLLGEHLMTAARNATYTSNTIQNQIIDVLADQVRQKIVQNVQAAKWYTVIADEVTDVSNKEQLSIVLRYIDGDSQSVREDLVGFVECDMGISGRSLANKIISYLEELGLDLNNLRGQAYDGAGNMAGSVNGTAAVISQQYPLATYLHCSSHCLNLAVVKSLEVTSVRNMMGVIGRTYQFYAAHPKRQRALEEAISNCQPSSAAHKLKDMCRTRWLQRIDAIEVFKCLHQSIVTCMERIYNDGPRLWSTDSLTDARGLQLAITSTDFLCALVITNSCLMHLQALTSNLQAETRDIVSAVREIENVTATIQDVRDHIQMHHSKWFLTVEKMCSDVGIVPSLPRRCGRQMHRSNIPADSPSEYYCRTISIPLLDHLLSEMNSRFGKQQQTVLLGLSIVPSILVSLSPEDCSSKASQLVDLYQSDLPSPECTQSELHCWQLKWQRQLEEYGQNSLPSSPTLTVRHTSSMFPNINILIRILCTLPVTTCSAERSFSGLKRIKTPFRSMMTTVRLSGLTLLNVHRDIPVDISSAINEFARRHPRRMKMVEILDEQ